MPLEELQRATVCFVYFTIKFQDFKVSNAIPHHQQDSFLSSPFATGVSLCNHDVKLHTKRVLRVIQKNINVTNHCIDFRARTLTWEYDKGALYSDLRREESEMSNSEDLFSKNLAFHILQKDSEVLMLWVQGDLGLEWSYRIVNTTNINLASSLEGHCVSWRTYYITHLTVVLLDMLTTVGNQQDLLSLQ